MKKGTQTKCDCDHIATSDGFTLGYGEDKRGKKICFACCGENDKRDMIKTGHSKNLPLYLTKKNGSYVVSNWPETLKFKCFHYKEGSHNIAGTRTDIWFTGPDSEPWWGKQIGEWTQICHCRRINRK